MSRNEATVMSIRCSASDRTLLTSKRFGRSNPRRPFVRVLPALHQRLCHVCEVDGDRGRARRDYDFLEDVLVGFGRDGCADWVVGEEGRGDGDEVKRVGRGAGDGMRLGARGGDGVLFGRVARVSIRAVLLDARCACPHISSLHPDAQSLVVFHFALEPLFATPPARLSGACYCIADALWVVESVWAGALALVLVIRVARCVQQWRQRG